mgnify:FL=1
MDCDRFKGVVEKIIFEGKHGPYIVASVEDIGLVTCSLDRDVWREVRQPEPGTYIILSGLTKKRAGWRATQGRFMQPSDENREKRRKEQ